MIYVKSPREQQSMRAAGAIAARVLRDVIVAVRPGITTLELDELAAQSMAALGATSAFLGHRRFPCHTCISVNDEVVHGLAGRRKLAFGDVVSVDVGVRYGGFIGDNAATVPVGGCTPAAQRLLDVTEEALHAGIAQAREGNTVRDVSRAIQALVEGSGFSVVREFVGHGVGRSIHEDPQVPNYVACGPTTKLVTGMTIAIEPMVNAGGASVRVLDDGWTVVTADGSLSAHFEHTVLVAGAAAEVLTRCPVVAGMSSPDTHGRQACQVSAD